MKTVNSKKIKSFKILSPVLVFLALFAVCYVKSVYAGPYLNSAHGSSSYGVKRSASDYSAPQSDPNYTKGLCAHCHEAHNSIDGAEPAPVPGPENYTLFYDNYVLQTDGFCFQCHTSSSSHQATAFNNYNYSYRAGGDTSITCPVDVLSAFSFINESGASVSNCSSSTGSSHKLTDIVTFITGRWGFTANSNPCSACHNPHSAQRDLHTSGNRGWPVSRPSLHNSKDNNAWGLWGDDASERMNNYTASYQAPYRKSPPSTYEPEGATQDGSNLTDYVTFCTDCHNSTNTIYSNHLGRNLKTIDWTGSGDMHGNKVRNADMDKGTLKAPYNDGSSYVLSCLDCHEPHGSSNAYLLRAEVNGVTVPNPISAANNANGAWNVFCLACHDVTDTGSGAACTAGLHGPPFATSLCTDCHSHGSSLCPAPPHPLF